jgi:hypothetical protein
MIYAALRQSARRGAEGRDVVSLIVNPRGRAMALYTIQLVDGRGVVWDTDELDCDTDEQAVAFADDLNVPAFGNGFDVWAKDRLVHRHREH